MNPYQDPVTIIFEVEDFEFEIQVQLTQAGSKSTYDHPGEPLDYECLSIRKCNPELYAESHGKQGFVEITMEELLSTLGLTTERIESLTVRVLQDALRDYIDCA